MATSKLTKAQLLERLEHLEQENAELRERISKEQDAIADASGVGESEANRAETSTPTDGRLDGSRRSPWWAVLSALLIIVGVGLAPVATTAAWAKTQLTDTSRFVAAYAPLAKDPAVQQVVIDEVVKALEREVDIPSLTADLVGGLGDLGSPRVAIAAKALQGAINRGLSALMVTTVTQFVQSDAFPAVWEQTLMVGHTQLLKTMRGDPNAALTILSDGTLQLQLTPIVESVKQALVDQGLTFVANLPSANISIPIASHVSLPAVQWGFGLVESLGFWLPWGALALVGAGVAVARSRRRAVAGAAWGLLIAMIGLLAALGLARSLLPTLTPLSAKAADAVFFAVADQPRHIGAAVATVSLILLVFTWITGPGRTATRLRAATAAAAASVRRSGEQRGISTGSFGRWCDRWRRFLQVSIGFLAGGAVLFLRPLTASGVGRTLAVAAVALLLLEFLRRPADRQDRQQGDLPPGDAGGDPHGTSGAAHVPPVPVT